MTKLTEKQAPWPVQGIKNQPPYDVSTFAEGEAGWWNKPNADPVKTMLPPQWKAAPLRSDAANIVLIGKPGVKGCLTATLPYKTTIEVALYWETPEEVAAGRRKNPSAQEMLIMRFKLEPFWATHFINILGSSNTEKEMQEKFEQLEREGFPESKESTLDSDMPEVSSQDVDSLQKEAGVEQTGGTTDVENPPKDSLWQTCVNKAREMKDKIAKFLRGVLAKISDKQKKIILIMLAITVLAIALYYLYKYKKQNSSAAIASLSKKEGLSTVSDSKSLIGTMFKAKQAMDKGNVPEAGTQAVASMTYLLKQ